MAVVRLRTGKELVHTNKEEEEDDSFERLPVDCVAVWSTNCRKSALLDTATHFAFFH